MRLGILVGLISGAAFAAPPAAKTAAVPKTTTITDAARAEAKQVFEQRCATCHGVSGKGDGAASAALNPKPRDFQDTAWQKSVTDAHIEKIIAEGGPAVGKSPLMPPNPDLTGKPVVPALREWVRGLGAKK
ncbi:MAG: c-type cytochrome [Myxococcaceae bacterium]